MTIGDFFSLFPDWVIPKEAKRVKILLTNW